MVFNGTPAPGGNLTGSISNGNVQYSGGASRR